MAWTFETGLAAFLLAAFAAQAIAAATGSRVSLQLALGAICVLGLAAGLLPPDFVEKSRMKEVGTIAFNVLIVHTGASLDFRALARERKAAALVLGSIALMAAASFLALAPVVGRDLAAASPGPVVGGGAACAIASVALGRARPGLAAYPWLVFMFQGLAGAPILAWALRRDRSRRAERPDNAMRDGVAQRVARNDVAGAGAEASPPGGDASSGAAGPAARIPARLKGPAYYLGSLMLVSLLNRRLSALVFARIGLGMTLTALLFGIALGRLGLLEREPLAKSDSMGLLMLGLMALMADALAGTPLPALAGLVPAALAATAAGAALLCALGAAGGAALGLGPWRGVALAAGCMASLPANLLLAKGLAAKGEADPGALPALAAGWSLAANLASIVLASYVGYLIC